MRMANGFSPQWVIKEATYFDHATHRFVAGDIEIAGEWIVAIRPPGTSAHACAWDARGFVCTPGLVKAHADPHTIATESEALLRAGITTAGTLCATARECIARASRTPLRLVTRLLLNPVAQARNEQRHPDARARAPELRALQRIEALVRRNDGRLALAVHCPSIVSAHELAYAQALAAALRLKLGFVLSDDEASARAFRDRFYSSETHLLDFMQLLRRGTTVWGRSQLTRNDIETLAASGANVSGLHAASLLERRARIGARAFANTTCTSRPTRLAALLDMPDSPADARWWVDAATRAAAAALGERTCGRIESGMRADLCLFRTPPGNVLGAGSEAFVELFEWGRPDVVLIAGATPRSVAAEGEASGSAPPQRMGARTCPPRALGANLLHMAQL
jgi:cytosine/adenosine deaminase-related metal-dependent hydrolase